MKFTRLLCGLMVSWLHSPAAAAPPAGFTPLFNGRDLTGWHISQINHHGNTTGWTVENGVLVGTQDRPGNGGILLTDRKFRDFEIYIEIKPDFGCDGGLFLRSNERGQAYQVMLDYLEGGSVGGIYGEGLKDVKGDRAPNWRQYWKADDWNALLVRIQGEVPRIQVWLNGHQLVDWQDTENHLPGGATEGMIGLQVHGGKRWVEGGKHRFRVVAVRELGK